MNAILIFSLILNAILLAACLLMLYSINGYNKKFKEMSLRNRRLAGKCAALGQTLDDAPEEDAPEEATTKAPAAPDPDPDETEALRAELTRLREDNAALQQENEQLQVMIGNEKAAAVTGIQQPEKPASLDETHDRIMELLAWGTEEPSAPPEDAPADEEENDDVVDAVDDDDEIPEPEPLITMTAYAQEPDDAAQDDSEDLEFPDDAPEDDSLE